MRKPMREGLIEGYRTTATAGAAPNGINTQPAYVFFCHPKCEAGDRHRPDHSQMTLAYTLLIKHRRGVHTACYREKAGQCRHVIPRSHLRVIRWAFESGLNAQADVQIVD